MGVAAPRPPAALVIDAPPEAPARLPLSRHARIAIQLLTVVSVALAAVSIGLWVVVSGHLHDRDALDEARNDAVSAARQEVVNLHGIKYTTIDADFKRVLDGATGAFKDQFGRAQKTIKPILVEHKTVMTATVRFAGVVRADTDSVTVLIGIDRTVSDSSAPAGAVNHYRLRVDVEKHGGRWLVSELQDVD